MDKISGSLTYFSQFYLRNENLANRTKHGASHIHNRAIKELEVIKKNSKFIRNRYREDKYSDKQIKSIEKALDDIEAFCKEEFKYEEIKSDEEE